MVPTPFASPVSTPISAAAAAGADVARKVVILARECGLQLGLSDLQVSSLVPAALQGVTVDDFMQQLPQVGVLGRHSDQL
jgi:aspartokinase/homoserine dehydrogenase 1